MPRMGFPRGIKTEALPALFTERKRIFYNEIGPQMGLMLMSYYPKTIPIIVPEV